MLSVSHQPGLAATNAPPQGPRLVGSLRALLDDVAAVHMAKMVLSNDRRRFIVRARQEWYYRCLTETDKSLSLIARIAKRNKSTVIFGAWQHSARYGLPAARGISRAHWKKSKPNGVVGPC